MPFFSQDHGRAAHDLERLRVHRSWLPCPRDSQLGRRSAIRLVRRLEAAEDGRARDGAGAGRSRHRKPRRRTGRGGTVGSLPPFLFHWRSRRSMRKMYWASLSSNGARSVVGASIARRPPPGAGSGRDAFLWREPCFVNRRKNAKQARTTRVTMSIVAIRVPILPVAAPTHCVMFFNYHPLFLPLSRQGSVKKGPKHSFPSLPYFS